MSFLQLSSMEAWLKAQEVSLSLNDTSLLARPSSAPLDPYGRSSMVSAASSPLPSLGLSQPFTLTTAVAGAPSPGSSPSSSPFRGSFLAGVNQDLLAAGALASAGLSGSTTSRYNTLLTGAGSGALGSKVSLMGVPDGATYTGGAAGSVGAYHVAAANEASPGATAALSRVPLPLVRTWD